MAEEGSKAEPPVDDNDPYPTGISTMLPTAIRSRIPSLGSLRRNRTMPNAPIPTLRRTKSSSSIQTPELSFAQSRPTTPDAEPTINNAVVVHRGKFDGQPGNHWDTAELGYSIWRAANYVAATQGDHQTARIMHIDAARYMYLSLPRDLSAAEIESLRNSMPPQLLSASNNVPQRLPPSHLRRLTSWSVQEPCLLCQVSLISGSRSVGMVLTVIFFVIPLGVTFINAILKFERRHQVTERALASFQALFTAAVSGASGEQDIDYPAACARFIGLTFVRPLVCYLQWLLDGVLGGATDGWEQAAARSGRANITADEVRL
jgi:hypothetical protein